MNITLKKTLIACFAVGIVALFSADLWVFGIAAISALAFLTLFSITFTALAVLIGAIMISIVFMEFLFILAPLLIVILLYKLIVYLTCQKTQNTTQLQSKNDTLS